MAIQLEERPVFMLGAERSGTTLIMAMIGCHPRIAVPEVVWYYPRFRPYVHTYGDLRKDENFRTLIAEMAFGLKTPFWGMPVNPRTLVDEIFESVRERSFAGVYRAMIERFARTAKKPRWGEKTPYNLFFVREIKEDFPNAQFIFITRDGRDASADYLQSGFGPNNIFCAAEVWKLCQNAVEPCRRQLRSSDWLDIKYERLVREPERTLREVCEFLGERYSPDMLQFHQTDLAKARGASRDHAPLGGPATDRYIGIYRELLSVREQRIFAAVAGEEMRRAGYPIDVEPLTIDASEVALYRELDGRIRAATLDAPEGHIVYESYNDWLVDQREDRRRRGIWRDAEENKPFPIGDPNEELITGQRAWRKWKNHLGVRRQYTGNKVML
jgi:hypothetical protein